MGTKNQTTWRQGDVLIMAITDRPAGDWKPEARTGKGVVLAYGEVTGHAHAIVSRTAKLHRRPTAPTVAEARAIVEDALLEAKAPIVLRHEEHAPVHLPRGRYVVRIQKEYSPGELRSVVD